MKSARVQLADDHLMFADPASRYLALHHEVFPPITSLEVLVADLEQNTPDVLLLDISFGKASSLPMISGLVRRFPELLIIMVTGNDSHAMVQRAMDDGARGYVLKDGGPAELLHAIETVRRGQVYISPELDRPRAPTRHRLSSPLSSRQRQVLLLLRRGFSEQRIAGAMAISLSTVEKHVGAIRSRLGIRGTRHVRWRLIQIDGLPDSTATDEGKRG